ncbi:MAG TPA: hypothetical protein VGF48_20725 [Thermoanaerobaculia bacterium]|jgi:hypothetical protein
MNKTVLNRIFEAAVVIAFAALIFMNYRLRRELDQARAEVRGLADALGRVSSGTSRGSFVQGDSVATKELVACAACGTQPWPEGRKMMLVVNPECASCDEAINNLKAAMPLKVPHVIVSTGDEASTLRLAHAHKLGSAMFRIPRQAPQRVKYMKTPQVMLVDGTSVVASCQNVQQCASMAAGQRTLASAATP